MTTLAALIFYFIGMTQLLDLFLVKKEDFERVYNRITIDMAAMCFSASVALLCIANM